MEQQRPLLVQTVTATSMAELRARRDEATEADLVELRLDGVADVDVAGALSGRRFPAIVTCRPVWEGGRFDGDEETRRSMLSQAVQAGAEYVDVERRADWMPDVRGTASRVIVSDHDFEHVPVDLTDRVRHMRAAGASIVKVAAQVSDLSGVFRLRDLVAAAGASGNTVVIGMGEAGQVTRLLPARFGSCWTYGGDAAPGQIAVTHLRHRYRVHTVTGTTTVFGVAGCPIAHSASPAMHNAALVAAGIDGVYVPLLARTPEDVATAARELDMSGVSLTAPLKSGWTSRADVRCDDEPSRRLGVVNTLKREAGFWLARNLDIAGFLDALDARGVALSGRTALVLGAGGAARSAAWALQSRGADVMVSARRQESAADLASDLAVRDVPWPPRGAWDLVVQATPVGTWPAVEASPLALDGLEAAVVYDLVYNPEDTRLLRDARAAGAMVIGGLDMLVGQAARQFEWWTGQQADVPAMRDAARRCVREMTGS